jgi:hypothetical protein
MSVFEPLFLLLVLVTGFTLVTALAFLVRGNFARAVRIGRRLAVGATIYFAIVIAVALVTPRREFRVGDTQCFDDWCIAVVEAHRAESPPAASYDVTLRLSNRARRMPMGEKGGGIADAQGRRQIRLPDEAMVLRHAATTRDIGDSALDTRDARMSVGFTRRRLSDRWLIAGEGGCHSRLIVPLNFEEPRPIQGCVWSAGADP